MQQVFYIHGGDAFTQYTDFLHYLEQREIRDLPNTQPITRWADTLRADLGETYELFQPMMPNKQNAKYNEWKIWFERHFEYLRDDIILIGGSLGGYFLAKYLSENQLPFRVKALFLLAAPFSNIIDEPYGENGGDFAFDISRVGELASKAEKIYILHSEDDFVVPYSHALSYKKALTEAELVTFADQGHFLQPAFPELINLIRTCC